MYQNEELNEKLMQICRSKKYMEKHINIWM